MDSKFTTPQERQQSRLSKAIKVKHLLAVLKQINPETVVNFSLSNFQLGDQLSIDEWKEVIYVNSSAEVRMYSEDNEDTIKLQFPEYVKQHIVKVD